MELFKIVYGDHTEIIKAGNYTKALNKAINNDVSLLGWVKAIYQKQGGKWVRKK